MLPLHQVGQGCPDLLVGQDGRNFLLEIKDPSQDSTHRRLTAAETNFHALWRGHATVVETVEQALTVVLGNNSSS